ncbi:hypothetical protein DN330_18615 [Salmonella enterica subsp. enterica serovar Eastbourne]|uniref:Uncharacterized protein n=2 Tax=Salmonella enterica TaxID=28901 RepID=A0A639UR03_SALER|nr:hypothetical protein [Salmonella enterica]EAA6211315.1 hypothetical protein [Salmonella enterica subsp. enterica serovar Virchow]EAA8041910.1 hypothetical protein [Salmonella enterica subsp. enterica]EAA9125305.1 hypothetical protein [Salmonella enterica subsp. enterica serovar Maastricht]EAT8420791.1 hypothetical protein [Salmonella enterica subsp. enterica serovar Chester]EBG0720939.1 hypothetical protein [Salmonella enterica subsp. enterica serovar Bredeney]EBL5542482.1 hypothetical pro
MELGFFKSSLKYNAAATIFCVFALYLSIPIFENVNFISNHPIIVSVLFILLVNSLLLIIYWTSHTKKTNSQPGIKGNKITGNKAKNINILSNGEITKNIVSNNESDGDINIGQGFKNGKK